MDTLVLTHGKGTYLVQQARTVSVDQAADLDISRSGVSSVPSDLVESNPFVTWVAGDFVEADRANSNRQYWTAGDLEMAAYTIKFAPLNMAHKFKTPVGFFAATKTVRLDREAAAQEWAAQTLSDVSSGSATVSTLGHAITSNQLHFDRADAPVLRMPRPGNLKIQALSGMWSHIFPEEAAAVRTADEAGALYYSMECRGSHLRCAGDAGCGQTFEYMAVDTHCEHLMERSSVRHIVNPVFRGGALLVPPIKPGWKDANASIVTKTVMQEAATFAAAHEREYEAANANGELTASAWEQLMAMVIAQGRS